jgi:AcrR family transcriptional regulator
MRAPGKALTREDVVDAAFRIADRDGLQALTMRRLGRVLGIEAGSLYHHVPGREALLDDLVSRLRAQIVPPVPVPPHWRDLFEAVFISYAAVLAAHPNLVPLAGRTVETDPEVNGLVYLVDLGLSIDDATALWQSIHALTIGFALLSSASIALDGSRLPDERLQTRYADWRLADLRRALRLLLDGYEPSAAAEHGATAAEPRSEGPAGTGTGDEQ